MKTPLKKISKISSILGLILLIILVSCKQQNKEITFKKVNHPEWTKNANIYEVNIRQFTPEGTFNAFAEHLPRLKELGIDILWLMPINPIGEKNIKGTIGSYYSVKDYYGINPEFGTEEDFLNLINKIHDLEMFVIIDWVANHSSWDNNLIVNHPEWYSKDENGEIISPNDDWTDVADFNFEVPEMRAYMIDALKYWVKEFNIDGYRCDVVWATPFDFWVDARHELDKIKPVFMLAEANEPELHDKAFDMTYGWDMHHLWNDIAQGKRNVNDLANQFEKEKAKYKSSDYRMYFTSNHDENSWKGSVFERMGDAAETFAVLSFTMPGMPLIYNGQEACMDKRLLFFDKDSIDWNIECNFAELYAHLIKLKKENPALWNGDFGGDMQRIKTTSDDKIFVFSRTKGDAQVITVLNLSPDEIEFEIINPTDNTKLTEVFTGEEFVNKYNFKAWDYKIFKTE
ncbi:MAG: alpha-amylase family glycosyl hydrolase [Bacteroidales bacterium]|jgi:cyclomaltodextrinase|nr:alpha-amylase family glycosyl hydrolase [Bacteroidales bacterium]